jgi:hypothetical protein
MEEAVDTNEMERVDRRDIPSKARKARSAPNIVHLRGEYLGMYYSSPPDSNETNRGYVVNDEKQSNVGGNRRARSDGIELGADNYEGGQTSTSEVELPTLSTHGYLQQATSTLRDTSLMTEIIRADRQASRSSTRTKSGLKSSTASKRKPSTSSNSHDIASRKSDKVDPENQQSQGYVLSSSFEDPKDPRASSNKRKCDAMLNLTNSSSQYARNQPIVLPGSKGPKQRRKSPNPWQRSQPSITSRQPLASLNVGNSTISSRANREKVLTSSYLEKGSSGTIVVQAPSSNESPAPPPKRRKRGTQAAAGLEAYFWR